MKPSLPRTSVTDPLQIATLDLPNGGAVGVTFCPGKQQPHALTGSWTRDLNLDLEVISSWGAVAVVTLMEQWELQALSVEQLGERFTQLGLEWFHLPIIDGNVPDEAWKARWIVVGPILHGYLDAGRRVVVHCKGGLGRAGTVAAQILVERGEAAQNAIGQVRAVRPGAIENDIQARYLAALPSGT